MVDKKCLYTAQKLKKKKVYQDGILRVHEGRQVCVLYAVNDRAAKLGSLETRSLTVGEMKGVLDGSISELEFEGYLVEVEDAIVQECARMTKTMAPELVKPRLPAGKPGGLAPFKPPSTVARKEPLSSQASGPAMNAASRFQGRYPAREKEPPTSSSSYTVGRAYQVDDAELDDIWQTGTSSSGDAGADGHPDSRPAAAAAAAAAATTTTTTTTTTSGAGAGEAVPSARRPLPRASDVCGSHTQLQVEPAGSTSSAYKRAASWRYPPQVAVPKRKKFQDDEGQGKSEVTVRGARAGAGPTKVQHNGTDENAGSDVNVFGFASVGLYGDAFAADKGTGATAPDGSNESDLW